MPNDKNVFSQMLANENNQKLREDISNLRKSLLSEKGDDLSYIIEIMRSLFVDIDNSQSLMQELAELSEEELAAFMAQIGNTILQLQQQGKRTESLLLKMIFSRLRRNIKKAKAKDQEEEKDIEAEYELDSLSKKQRKELMILLKKAMIYKVYQALNPRRIAGETELTNYVKNLMLHGKDFADKYAHNPKDMQKEAKAFVGKKAWNNLTKDNTIGSIVAAGPFASKNQSNDTGRSI